VHPLPVDCHNRPIIIFLTVCTKNRRPILTNVQMHAVIRAAWISANHWMVGRYIIMPDHIHLFCAPAYLEPKPLGNWMRFWKCEVCKATAAEEGTLWQRDFWDTQLRQADSYAAKWEYVRNNPVRAGLVSRAEDWPHQGELNVLRWRD
jgi:putative transposase